MDTGHGLREIRDRTLKSIQFKLKSQICQPSELAYNKQALVLLLKTLDSTECLPVALDILGRVIDHPLARQTILKNGGITCLQAIMSDPSKYSDTDTKRALDDVLSKIVQSDARAHLPPQTISADWERSNPLLGQSRSAVRTPSPSPSTSSAIATIKSEANAYMTKPIMANAPTDQQHLTSFQTLQAEHGSVLSHNAAMASQSRAGFRPPVPSSRLDYSNPGGHAVAADKTATIPSSNRNFTHSAKPQHGFELSSERSDILDLRQTSPPPSGVINPVITSVELSGTFQDLEYIYLSPIDEDIINEFMFYLDGTGAEFETEEYLFDIISKDFGGQLFLQRPALFETLLKTLHFSSCHDRLSQSLMYLAELINCWCSTAFRKGFDKRLRPAAVPSHALYESSGSLRAVTPLLEQRAIPVAAACHECFVQLVPLLKNVNFCFNVLALIHNISPLLKIFASEQATTSAGDTKDPVMLYIRSLIDVIGYYGICITTLDPNAHGIHVLMRERLVVFVMEFIVGFSPNRWAEAASGAVHLLCDLPTPNSLPKTIMQHIQKFPETFDVAYFLAHQNQWVLAETLVELRQITSGFHLSSLAIQALIFNGLSSQNSAVQASALDYLHKNSASIKGMLSILWIQAYYEIDDGQLYERIRSHVAPIHLDAKDLLLLDVRGLYHKSEKLRQFSTQKLVASPVFLDETVNPNCLNFPDVIPVGRGMADPQVNLSGVAIASSHQHENVKLEKLLDTLKHVSASAEDGTMKRAALTKLRNLLSVPTLTRKAVDLKFDFSLVALLAEDDRQSKSSNLNATSSSTPWLSMESRADALACLVALLEFHFAVRRRLSRDSMISLLPMLCSPVTEIRFLTARALSCIFFEAGVHEYNELQLSYPPIFPDFIASQYSVYTPHQAYKLTVTLDFKQMGCIEYISQFFSNYRNILSLPTGEILAGFLPNPVVQECEQAIETIREAKSHLAFLESLRKLESYCVGPADFPASKRKVWHDQILNRFLCSRPASDEDAVLLIELLKFLRQVPISLVSLGVLIRSIGSVMLPILKSQGSSDQESLGKEYLLNYNIICFLKRSVQQLNELELLQVQRETGILAVLKDYAHRIFSDAHQPQHYDHTERLRCLACLHSFILAPLALEVTGSTLLIELTQIFVQIIGYSQQNFLNSTDGNGFTYRDRSIYRCVTNCLRDLSCTISKWETMSSVAWGDHWLFENDINWLLVILNEDEKIMLKYGLGILSNLILLRDSYQHLCQKIPQFLDMALSYCLDIERCFPIRKESLLIINNFLITFVQDNNLNPILGSLDAENSIGAEGRDDSSSAYVLLNIFDQCGFFDRLSFLVRSEGYIMYQLTLSELLLNLTLLAPGVIARKLTETESWPVFLEGLSELSDSEMATVSTPDAICRYRQLLSSHSNTKAQLQINILQLLIVLSSQNASVLNLLTGENAIRRLFMNVGALQEASSRWPVKLNLVLILFSMCLEPISISDPGYLLEMFSTVRVAETASLLNLLQECIHQRQHEELCRSATLVLARLLTLHYGEVIVFPAFNQALEEQLDSESIGEKLCSSLVCHLAAMESLDHPHRESVQLAMQCLLGRCITVKRASLSSLPSLLCNKIKKWLSVPKWGSNGDSVQAELAIYFSMFRHLFAGSVEAKSTGYHYSVHTLIYQVLQRKEASEMLILEALSSLANLIANCNSTKKAVFDSKVGMRLVEVCLSLFTGQNTSETVMLAIADVWKLICTLSESRVALFKMNCVAELDTFMTKCRKAKDYYKLTVTFYLIHALTSFTDGQVYVLKVAGFMDQMFELLGVPNVHVRLSTLIALRNVALSKESKTHFVADDAFISKIPKLLRSQNTAVLECIISIIWILAYDSEKVKVAFRRLNVRAEVDEMILRLGVLKDDEDVNKTALGYANNVLHVLQ